MTSGGSAYSPAGPNASKTIPFREPETDDHANATVPRKPTLVLQVGGDTLTLTHDSYSGSTADQTGTQRAAIRSAGNSHAIIKLKMLFHVWRTHNQMRSSSIATLTRQIASLFPLDYFLMV